MSIEIEFQTEDSGHKHRGDDLGYELFGEIALRKSTTFLVPVGALVKITILGKRSSCFGVTSHAHEELSNYIA